MTKNNPFSKSNKISHKNNFHQYKVFIKEFRWLMRTNHNNTSHSKFNQSRLNSSFNLNSQLFNNSRFLLNKSNNPCNSNKTFLNSNSHIWTHLSLMFLNCSWILNNQTSSIIRSLSSLSLINLMNSLNSLLLQNDLTRWLWKGNAKMVSKKT